MTITLDPPTPVVPPVDDATRREFLTIIGAAGLIAACGDDARDGERAGSAAAEARTVAGVAGLVQIPIDLQRVVNVNNSEVDDDLGALGIVPVGIGFRSTSYLTRTAASLTPP